MAYRRLQLEFQEVKHFWYKTGPYQALEKVEADPKNEIDNKEDEWDR